MNRRAIIDGLIVLGITTVGLVFVLNLDLYDLYYESTRRFEGHEIDEILIFAPFFLALGLAWFSFRRLQQLKQKDAQREKAEREKGFLEASLLQTQKLESIGTLAGGIAHDFNNLLSPIIGYSDLMLKDSQGNGEHEHGLKEIYVAATRAKQLVGQILTFSREAKPDIKPLKVQTMVEEVLQLTRSTIPADIDLQYTLCNTCGYVMADPIQIHQVIMNLITNACHAMEHTGGTLDIRLDAVDFGPKNRKTPDFLHGSYVSLTVSDTGTGIAKSVLERIYDPFFTTKARDRGTGLGLSVVHGIVSSLGGVIGVFSRLGEGTSFIIYLPAVENREMVLENEGRIPIPRGTERILLVDDENQVALLQKEMLERLGYHITPRTSSIEALEAFRAKPHDFDLVISEMVMPKMNGTRLAGEILNIRSDIPIILCTGFSGPLLKNQAADVNVDAIIMKPVALHELAKTVRSVLDRPRSEKSAAGFQRWGSVPVG